MTARGWDRSGLAPRRPCNLSVNLKVLKTKTVCLKYDTSKRFKRGLKSAKITLSSGRVRAGALRCGPRLYRGHFASARDAPERQGAAEVAGPRGRGAEPGEGRQRPCALWRLRGRSPRPASPSPGPRGASPSPPPPPRLAQGSAPDAQAAVSNVPLQVSAFSTWEKELHKIVFDPRYLLLNAEERKQVTPRRARVGGPDPASEGAHPARRGEGAQWPLWPACLWAGS